MIAKRLFTRRVNAVLALIVMALSICSVFVPQKAEAWTNSNLPTCNIDLSWDWKTKATAVMVAADPTTPYSVESYPVSIMYQTSDGKTNLALGSDGYFDKDAASGHYFVRFKDSANATGKITSFYLNLSTKTVTSSGQVPPYYTGVPYSLSPVSTPDVTCVRYADGFNYTAAWDAQRFGSVMPLESSSDCAGALDVGCWIAKAFNGVSDGIKDVAQATLKAFTSLWIPDGDKTKDQFDGLSSMLTNKLGFLSYPFVWFADLFDVFQTGGTWCNTTSCSWTGTVMNGGHYTFDLISLSHNGFSPVWNYFLLFIRGTTVVGLLFMLQRKLLEVMQR